MPELLDLSTAALLAVYGIVALAGFVHGTLGLGFPLVSTPLLSLFVDVRSAILITLLPTVAVNVASILRGGRWGESIGRYWPFAVYAVAGTVAGTHLLVVNDPAPFKLLLAALVGLYLVVSRMERIGFGWIAAHHHASMAAFGLVAGLSAGTTNVMVPILIVYTLELGLARTAMVQVFNLSFLAGKVSQIGVFGNAGILGAGLLVATVPVAGVALVALMLGMTLRDRVPTAVYQRVVRALLAVIAAVLIAQYFSATGPL